MTTDCSIILYGHTKGGLFIFHLGSFASIFAQVTIDADGAWKSVYVWRAVLNWRDVCDTFVCVTDG